MFVASGDAITHSSCDSANIAKDGKLTREATRCQIGEHTALTEAAAHTYDTGLGQSEAWCESIECGCIAPALRGLSPPVVVCFCDI